MVTLPHDWAVEHPFDKCHASGTGYLPGGTAWYRKHFVLGEETKGKRVRLTFQGVYKHAKVWVNSNYLGFHAYGYGQMRFACTNRSVKDEVFVFLYELAAFQFLLAESWRKLNAPVLVTFKSLVDWESGPFHEPVALVLISGRKFLLENMKQEFFLLWCCLILANIGNIAAEKELVGSLTDFLIQSSLHLRCHAGYLLSEMPGHRQRGMDQL